MKIKIYRAYKTIDNSVVFGQVLKVGNEYIIYDRNNKQWKVKKQTIQEQSPFTCHDYYEDVRRLYEGDLIMSSAYPFYFEGKKNVSDGFGGYTDLKESFSYYGEIIKDEICGWGIGIHKFAESSASGLCDSDWTSIADFKGFIRNFVLIGNVLDKNGETLKAAPEWVKDRIRRKANG